MYWYTKLNLTRARFNFSVINFRFLDSSGDDFPDKYIIIIFLFFWTLRTISAAEIGNDSGRAGCDWKPIDFLAAAPGPW